VTPRREYPTIDNLRKSHGWNVYANDLLTFLSTRLDIFVNLLYNSVVTVGELIRAARKREGLSQGALAQMLQMDISTLSRVENGTRFPGRNFAARLSVFLGLPLDEVYKLIDEQKRPIKLNESIEVFAHEDRTRFLTIMRRNTLEFPADYKRIPKMLYGLDVVTEETVLTGSRSKMFRAAMFLGNQRYHGRNDLIVVATNNVKEKARKHSEYASLQTVTFNVLHELGHYRIHWMAQANNLTTPVSDAPLYCSSDDTSPKENQADTYASAFLMPKGEILAMIEHRSIFNTRKDGKRLCRYFFVEPWMLAIRLSKLGVMVMEETFE
jgi:transcriptional regulator with XRE-family HTH domain